MGNHAKHSTADLAPGDHLCIVYETDDERNSALIEYFRCGLDKNEKILYITDIHDDRRISRCLNENGLDIDGCLVNGQMKIIDISDKRLSYPDEILELVRSESKGILEEGYTALRIAVETISSDSIKAAEYEAKIDDFIQGLGCLTLCLYNQSRFDPGTIMDILRAHPLVMVGAEVCRNLYYIPPEDLGRDSAMVLCAKERLLEHRHAEVRAQELERKFQEIVENMAFPINTNNGFMVRTISRDITKDKEAKDALRQSEEKYRAIIENIRDIVYTNSPDGKVTFISPNISIAGYLPGEVLGHDLAEFVYPDDRVRVMGDLERALRTGESFPTAFRLLKKDGGYIHVEEMGKPVIRGGKVVEITGSVRDVTGQQKAKEALYQSEKKYRQLVDNLNEGIWAIDAHANTTFVNNRMAEILGYSASEMLGRSLFSFMDETGAKIASRYIEHRRQGIREKHGFEFISKNGTRVYTLIETSPIIDDSGRYTGALAAVADVTESKLDEERLSLSEARYRMLFENSPMGIISIDTRGNILEANPVLLELLGSPSMEDTCTINVLTYQPLIRAGFTERFVRCMDSGQVLTFENLYTTEGSRCSYLKLKLTPVRDRLGRITGAQATVEDVSDHKRAEKALQENLQFLQRLIDTIPNPVYYQNLNCVLLGCNKAFEKMFSLTRDDIIGRKIHDLDLAGDLADEFGRADQNLLCDPGIQTFESSSVMADGQTHHVINYRATYTNASGKVAGIVGTILDITERKRIEDERALLIKELESRNAEMERFVYTVSHDLRSPLVTISGFVGLLKTDIEKGSHDRVLMDLRMIDDATYRMDKLLRDTLELSRIGRVASPEEAISIDEIIDEALSQTRGKITANGVLISKEVGLPRVYVDRMRIVEAVVNLIENSLKYMGDQVRPEIQLGSRIKEGETVFFVRDNGMGIEKSQHEKVFELFYKVDRKSDGTGAGLAIVKRIIEVHGGRIWIESEKGTGCTICFTLPVVNDPCALSN